MTERVSCSSQPLQNMLPEEMSPLHFQGIRVFNIDNAAEGRWRSDGWSPKRWLPRGAGTGPRPNYKRNTLRVLGRRVFRGQASQGRRCVSGCGADILGSESTRAKLKCGIQQELDRKRGALPGASDPDAQLWKGPSHFGTRSACFGTALGHTDFVSTCHMEKLEEHDVFLARIPRICNQRGRCSCIVLEVEPIIC